MPHPWNILDEMPGAPTADDCKQSQNVIIQNGVKKKTNKGWRECNFGEGKLSLESVDEAAIAISRWNHYLVSVVIVRQTQDDILN